MIYNGSSKDTHIVYIYIKSGMPEAGQHSKHGRHKNVKLAMDTRCNSHVRFLCVHLRGVQSVISVHDLITRSSLNPSEIIFFLGACQHSLCACVRMVVVVVVVCV